MSEIASGIKRARDLSVASELFCVDIGDGVDLGSMRLGSPYDGFLQDLSGDSVRML
jgi:hypothetical protein